MSTRLRLSFCIAPERHRAFARLFAERLSGPLARFGLTGAVPPDRPQDRDWFARVFAVPAADPGLPSRLAADAPWASAVAAVATEYGVGGPSWRLTPYSAAAGPGRTVDAGAGYRQGAWHGFSVQDGLPSSLIKGLLPAPDGVLWLQTHEAGLCRFDGESFTTYSRADGLPPDIGPPVADTRGHLWMTTAAGLCRYDGARFDTFTIEDGLPADTATAPLLATGDGSVWFVAAGGGVARFDGAAFNRVPGAPPGGGITCLCQGRDGEVWFGTAGGGLWHWSGAALTCRATPRELPGGAIAFLAHDRAGRLWINAEAGAARLTDGRLELASALLPECQGAARFLIEDGGGRLWFADESGLVAYGAAAREAQLGICGRHALRGSRGLGRVVADRRGDLWASDTISGGLLRFDERRLEHFTTRTGLGHNRVYAIVEDGAGNIWVGSWGGGLNRFDGHRMRSYTTDDGLAHDEVESIAEDADGRLWFATRGGGASRFDGTGFRTYTTADGLGADFLWCVTPDRHGRLWFGTNAGGATCLDGDRMTTLTTADGLAHDNIWSIVEDRRGRLWFTTQGGGVSCLDGESLRTYTAADGLAHDWVWSVVEAEDGDLWFPTWAGVSRFDGTTFTTYTTADGLAYDNVWCGRRARDGRLWFGTWGGGASVWDPGTTAFTTYTTADGLADNNVRAIAEDREGRLWFSTYGGGVSLYDGRVFQTISRKDGLVHDAVQDVHLDGQDWAWIATEAGVTRYQRSTAPPRVRLGGVIADQAHGPADEIALPSSQKFIIVEFHGGSFTTPRERLAYVYRLRGLHDDWRATYARRVEYADLAVGDYRFEVRAVDRDLNYSDPAALTLSVYADTRRDRMEALEAQLSQPRGLEQFIGGSQALQKALSQIQMVADTDVTVLVLGETGTGKGLAARAIHGMSRRGDQPFLQVNCGAIPEGLVESELFGHEKGAFTGAVARRIGHFELADGGTLFLDEVGDLPLASQQVLLQVLQDGTLQRVGGDDPIRVDVRIVAATNRDLQEAMRHGTFREDLYYRLNAFVLHLPPLRQRQEDIPLLVEHFLERFSRHLHRPVPEIDGRVFDYLRRWGWPGNVRELEHVVQRGILVCRDGLLRFEDLFLSEAPPAEGPAPASGIVSLDDHQRLLEEQQRQLIESALKATNWVVYGDRGAARLLGTHPEKLRVRMRKLGLQRPRR